MRKIAVLIAVVLVAALAAPALSETNPFMDVPMNHWAYDAIGQLAAYGILSGYPDGLYKGKQQTTRYEMASAVARALAVVDMTKAGKEEVEQLKRLVVEFKDELEALGVRVDELDDRVAILEDRLGGWHIHGDLALEVIYQKKNDDPDPDGSVEYDDAKLWIERTWGEDGEYHFAARFNNDNTDKNGTWADRFFVEMPFFLESRLTLGRFAPNWENEYRMGKGAVSAVQTGSWFGDTQITDWRMDAMMFSKNFGIGNVDFVVAHPNGGAGDKNVALNGSIFNNMNARNNRDAVVNTWMLMARGRFQFTEQLGFDIGGQAFLGDNSSQATGNRYANGDVSFNKLWTIYGGLRFNFNDNVAFKGIFYHQKMETEVADLANLRWVDAGYGITNNGKVVDDANHWAVMVDVKQEALKFTSAWLEYGQYEQGFMTRSNDSIFYAPTFDRRQADNDIKYWRVALGQQWNDKWATHIFYNGYVIENALANNKDAKPSEIGVGVQYHLNDYTTMGLNYVHVKTDNYQGQDKNDDVVRFRTAVSF